MNSGTGLMVLGVVLFGVAIVAGWGKSFFQFPAIIIGVAGLACLVIGFSTSERVLTQDTASTL